ncbi:DUF1850 domain-containing protein [Indioceanicola profundi]|uniref:DUF1850 domain-containing protein n=1 Tax=Indioceanicola profundi TaxID=2220096 RepID=UPI0013C52BFC|nr:DUF1850 domain-containing protein [Indioceanicola profundi]
MSGPALSLCIALIGGDPVRVPAVAFELRWTHSVEKIEWQEDWRATPAGLRVVSARIRGSGAGMEPPDDARLEDGWWVYTPGIGPQERVVLAASDFTADHILCAGGSCKELSDWVHRPAGDDRPVEMSVCSR